jgi:hypothetical protein
VLSELSWPERIEGGFVVSWRERIIIAGPDDWGKLLSGEPDEDAGPDIDFDVRVQ